MQLGEWKDVLTILNTLGIAVVAFLTWMRKPGVDAGAAVEALEEQQNQVHEKHRERLTKLEERMQHLATSEELTELAGTVGRIDERTQALAESMEPIRSSLDRIQDFLLKGRLTK